MRMFDLNTRIDLDEIELIGIGIHQEFDRAGMGVIDRLAQFDGRRADGLTLTLAQIRRRRPFNHFLIASLNRTIALEQMQQVAMLITQQLHLDVARIAHQLFDIDLVIAKRTGRFAPGDLDLRAQIVGRFDDAHAAPTAAPTGLEHDRVTHGSGRGVGLVHVMRKRLGGRHYRHIGSNRRMTSRHLVAQRCHHLCARANEGNAGGFTGGGEIRVFGQKAVAGMNRVSACGPRDPDHIVDIEISLQGFLASAYLITFICLETVQGKTVFVGIDCHGANAQLGCGAHDPDCYLRTVCYQNLLDFSHSLDICRQPGPHTSRFSESE